MCEGAPFALARGDRLVQDKGLLRVPRCPDHAVLPLMEDVYNPTPGQLLFGPLFWVKRGRPQRGGDLCEHRHAPAAWRNIPKNTLIPASIYFSSGRSMTRNVFLAPV